MKNQLKFLCRFVYHCCGSGNKCFNHAGAKQGLYFLFHPDFSAINSKVILSALGQCFFSLSLGMGCYSEIARRFIFQKGCQFAKNRHHRWLYGYFCCNYGRHHNFPGGIFRSRNGAGTRPEPCIYCFTQYFLIQP